MTDGVSIDLDASCVYLDEKLQPIDTVHFRKLQSDDGALVHSGDQRVGNAAGDDESIRVRPPPISNDSLVFSSFGCLSTS